MPRTKQSRNVAKARRLRATMSLPETLLWTRLRQQQTVKFRRQHPIGPWVLDFYCARAKLCIEIDGIAHDMGSRPGHDERRNAHLRTQGIEVIRIPATDVLRSPETVAEALVALCRERTPPSA